MKNILLFVLHMLLIILRALQPGGIRKIAAENVMLRQQLMIVRRRQKRAPKLSVLDRFIFGFLAAVVHPRRLSRIAMIVQPATLLKFHQALVKRKYFLLFSAKRQLKPGPKGPSQEIIDLVIEMKSRNLSFGYRRIAMQISHVLNIEIDKDVVRRILAQFGSDKFDNHGPSWLTFFGNMKDSLWSIDLFRCESILLKSHWVVVVMDQFTRRVIGFAVHAGTVDGVTLCCMFNKIISNQKLPKYLSSDHDPLFNFHRWHANLRILDIEEIKSVPYAPMSHPFIERLIGTVRRELLDKIFFWNQSDLEAKLTRFMSYYNDARCHWSLKGKIPREVEVNHLSNSIHFNGIRWKKYCNGLYRLPVAA